MCCPVAFLRFRADLTCGSEGADDRGLASQFAVGSDMHSEASAGRSTADDWYRTAGNFMKGYQITFFTQLNKRHHGMPLADWLVQTAKEMGMPGATLIAASEGFGRHRRIHSAHFFELAEQPQEIQLAASESDTERLFTRLKGEGVHLFYVKNLVEFGTLGDAES